MQDHLNNFKFGIARTPPISMAKGITTKNMQVDPQLARKQHQHYLKNLKDIGVSVSLLDPDENFPDSHFVEDTAIIYKQHAILTRPGALIRQREVDSMRNVLQKQPLKLHELSDENDATVDGGDVLIVGEQVLIGLSYRTNVKGANALALILKKIDPKVTIHFIEFSGVLHLKSGLVALTEQLFLGNPHMKLKQPLPIGKVMWLPEKEGYAANSLVANGAAFVFAECLTAQNLVEKAGLKVIPLDISEFHKMDGSFTCLSLLW